jgi:hypothetical protein
MLLEKIVPAPGYGKSNWQVGLNIAYIMWMEDRSLAKIDMMLGDFLMHHA